jgi:alpha-L-arabinofuranosidase
MNETRKSTARRAVRFPDAIHLIGAFAASILIAGALAAAPPKARIEVDAGAPGVKSSPMLWGIFFEEINHAGDGGLYAELVRNGSFEDAASPEAWSAAGDAKISVEREDLLNAAQKRCLRIEAAGAGAGAENPGYWGIAAKEGAKYRLSLYARGPGAALIVRILSSGGDTIAESAIEGAGPEWKRLEATLVARKTDPGARLAILLAAPGSVRIDCVSLFPAETWKGRENGLRPDLAQMLDDLAPAFVRFPGGCFVEGNRLANGTRWKTTIGPVPERPGHLNAIWAYRSTNGLGYHEYLQMCEDLRSEPLFVINCGMAHEDVVPMKDLDEWVGDALDAIEYANGPVTSPWGAGRARNGHPAPFGLEYLEIGNENGGPAYEERYARFHAAVKARHPDVRIIANVPVKSAPFDILDEHFYSSPDWFASQAGRYDRYDRSGPKIYVGEYACTQDCGKGNLKAALGEAAFMAGMERNSDIVVMASYAPLFVNANDRRWNPDAIVFDSSRVHGTPSYHVQKLFSRNRVDAVLPVKVDVEKETAGRRKVEGKPGAIGLGTWVTQAEYREVKVTRGGATLFSEDFAGGSGRWKVFKGDWKADGGRYCQKANADDCRSTAGDPTWNDYTLSLKARKLGGAEGFLVMFRVRDDRNWYWWNIGGWGNARHAIEKCSGGGKSIAGDPVNGGVETGRWYDVRIELDGPRIRCFLDGKLIHDVEEGVAQTLFASAGWAGAGKELVLKVVNYQEAAQEAQIAIRAGGRPAEGIAAEGKAIVITSGSPTDENTLENPLKVAPVERKAPGLRESFAFIFEPWSLTILRIPAGK